jgi:hypothetical protein
MSSTHEASPSQMIKTIFHAFVDLTDVVPCSESHVNLLKSFGLVGARKLHVPTDKGNCPKYCALRYLVCT